MDFLARGGLYDVTRVDTHADAMGRTRERGFIIAALQACTVLATF